MNNKKGISLIVLVITIIVMIILAAAIILSLNGSNIIGKANEAKTKSDIANARYVVSLAKSEWDLMSRSEQSKITGGFKSYAEDKLEEAGYKTGAGKNSYAVTLSGQVINSGKNNMYVGSDSRAAVIPEGFTVSTNTAEDTVTEGLVIKDSEGNEFVWVPVDDYSKFQRTTTYKPDEGITPPVDDYATEPISYACSIFDYDEWECADTEILSLENDITGEWKEEAAMRASVELNGGFYIGRYETGTTTCRKEDNDNGTTDVLVQKDKYVYNFVGTGKTTTDLNSDIIETDYNVNNGVGAIKLARNMYKNWTSVVSTLCYGVQWDAALRFISTNKEHENYAYDSSGKGWYAFTSSWNDKNPKAPHLTGYYPTNNIYDMAGNVSEWTMEGYHDGRIARGGYFKQLGSYSSADNRNPRYPHGADEVCGFRVALYIK